MTAQFSLNDKHAPIHSEILLGHTTLVPGPFLDVIHDGGIMIRAGKIIQTGPTAVLRKKFKNTPFIDAKSYIAIPGLFNSHTHVAMGFFRGLGHGKENMIESFLFPAEKSLTPELLEPLSYSYIYDGLRAGVTSFVDHYYFSSGIARAFEKFGVRGWVGETVADLGGAFPGVKSWERARELIEKSSFSSLIRHVVAPHAADTVSSKLLRECADYARKNDIPLHMHLSQSPSELERVKKRDHLTPVAMAERAEALGPNSLVVHLTSADHDDLKIIKKHGATIGYCPTSTVIYDRLADIKSFYELDIPLAIGTDCAASNDSADCLAEIKIAAILARNRGVDSGKLSPDNLLALATTNPTRALGVSETLGSLEAGKCADLVLMKKSLSSMPSENLLANILYSMGSRDVSHVMVNGSWRLWCGALPHLNESDLSEQYTSAVAEIRRRIILTH